MDMGNLIYIGNGCLFYPIKFWGQGKEVYLPIVLYLYTRKRKVPLCRVKKILGFLGKRQGSVRDACAMFGNLPDGPALAS